MERPVYTTTIVTPRREPGSGARYLSETSSSAPVATGAAVSRFQRVRLATYLGVKRLLDLAGAFIGLLLLFLPLLVLAALVRRDSPGSVFHRRRVLKQQRYLTSQTPATFDAFKLRTMIVDADEYLKRHPELLREFQRDYKLREDPRVTRLGRKLRTTSLDELPQLLNVLRGQMSLVGPRIISPPELENYGENAARLLSVKPGLTGLWQVSGRQYVSYQERVRLDMWYIENRSLALDIRILLQTVRCVLLRQGAY